MAKKKSAKSKLATFRNASRKPVAARKNTGFLGGMQSEVKGLAPVVGAGAGGYLATRLVGRIGRATLGKKIMGGRFDKHVGTASTLLGLLALYVATSKWQRLKRYQEPVLIGSAIAVLQSVLQTFLPGLGSLLDVGAPVATSGLGTTAVNGFKRKMGPRKKKIRYVSIGELESEEAIRKEREDRGEADEVDSQSPEAYDEIPSQDPLEGSSGDGLGEYADESEEIQSLIEENEQLRDLYGSFAPN